MKLVAGLLVALCLSGCATVNPRSAQRLAEEAQLTTRALSARLETTRRDLETYVEGQTIAAKLSEREPLSDAALCSIRSVQRSLRLRVVLLRALSRLYTRFSDLATYTVVDGGPVVDNLMLDIDRESLRPDAVVGPECPAEPDPPLPVLPTPPPVNAWLGVSQSETLRVASIRVRLLLGKVRELFAKDQRKLRSIDEVMRTTQKSLTRTLVERYGTVSPEAVFGPQLESVGARWDDRAYQKQLATFTPQQREAIKESVLAVLTRRSERRMAELAAQQSEHDALLGALIRQHEVLEAGLPLDLRQIAVTLVPLLEAANQAVSPTPQAAGMTGCR